MVVRMVKPVKPVKKSYMPPGGKRVRVGLGESWESVARKYCGSSGGKKVAQSRGLALAYYNYRSLNPDHINWYLYHHYGSRYSDDGFNNWAFDSFAEPGTIFVPAPGKGKNASASTNGVWFGVGVQVSGRLLFGADATYGVLYNTQYNGEGVPNTVRYADIMDEGYTFGAGLGGSAGLVLMFAHGITTAADFESWGTTWTDFALSFGPNVKTATSLAPALAKLPQLKSLAGFGESLSHVEAGYEKVKHLKTVAENVIKNRKVLEPGLYMIPLTDGVEIGIGGRAHLTTLVESGIYRPLANHNERSKQNEEIRRKQDTVYRPKF